MCQESIRDYPALMYMKDERPLKPTITYKAATDARNQEMQTDKSYMRDHWIKERSDSDSLAKPSQTDASYLFDHHSPTRSDEIIGGELNAKTSQTETSYIHDQYILDREKNTNTGRASQTQVYAMDKFHYPTQYQCPGTSRGVCTCRSQSSMKKSHPMTLSCQTDYPAESVRTVKSQPSVPTCSSKVDANPQACGVSNHSVNPCQTSDQNFQLYNQPSFGCEEQTSCTTRSRSVVDKITCLCSSSHHPKAACHIQRDKEPATCGRSVSERTLELKCSKTGCVCPTKQSAHSQLSNPPGKSASKHVSVANNQKSHPGEIYRDCESSSNASIEKSGRIVTSCHASKEPSEKALIESSKSEPIVTSCHTSEDLLITTGNKTSERHIATSCYTSKEPSLKTAFIGGPSCECPEKDEPKSQPTLAVCNSSDVRPDSDHCNPVSGHSLGKEAQEGTMCEQYSAFRSVPVSSHIIVCKSSSKKPDSGPVTRKKRILDMIEQLSNAADCECNEEDRPKLIQQLFRELTLMIAQEPECAVAPQDEPAPPTPAFEECCAGQNDGQQAVEINEPKKQHKFSECFAQLEEVMKKCFQKSKPKPLPLKEIGGFELDPDFRPFETPKLDEPPVMDSEEAQMEDEAELSESESDVFVGWCDDDDDEAMATLQEHNETESELCQQLMEMVGDSNLPDTEDGPCPTDCPPPDPCKMMEQYRDTALIPNGPLSPQARQLFELLLRQALRECEDGGHTGDEDYEEESLQHGVPEPHPEPCCCCHCRALLCENECKSVSKTVDAAMCDPVCEMKFFIDSIIVDLHAMDHVLNKKKAKPKDVKRSRDLDKPPRESFPVTITEVSNLGCTALYIRWEVLDCVGIAGYEIYVDGHLTNRFYSFRHEAAVVANVDVNKTHQIVLRAQAVGQDFPGEGCGNNSQAVVSAHPEMLVGAEKPWSPSVYFYDPS
ncbi:uncharacterized protein Dwil_GK11262, isoform A [Drosophila willistoni]|uniref:Uncharacterized protein, isoform A n=1 Tax=Drosophila willistoni TaxID=7260 RepID=B4NB19_DROWI|nr:uncharacterized protein LOC6647864 isoform X5 [Drosophila willistoni]EDW80983.2 uncharacterized protein Dwil_GK11262, isoform A [Drosophila willistoni]